MPITVTVPEETTTRFVVAADRTPDDIAAALRQGLPGRLGAAMFQRLGTPALMVAVHKAAVSPWDLRPVASTDPDDAERARRSDWHVGVTSVLPVADLPIGPHITRATAEALAESLGGVPVDLDIDQVVQPRSAPRPEDFALADGWTGAALPPYRNAGRCTADEDEIDGCSCVGLTTRGLRRFGLPDLEITSVACPHDLAALNILRTAAQRLLPLGRHRGEHVLHSELVLTSADFSAFWGSHEQIWDDGPVPVRLVQTGPHRLAVQAPEDFPGSLNEWLWDELPPVLHHYLSCEPDDTDPD
ncbi:hypothetical protein [Actinomadura violacea]|uniref:Uncharacterized protein n=1 Tax=Actinomadura violacea TaxID=2819934 RepID=A0ABS3S1D0_9ACTN|nr:hypothetical protein [Actinomadura violacea]MBO2462767.1 hypothetical protein [Actinomadura violacea]